MKRQVINLSLAFSAFVWMACDPTPKTPIEEQPKEEPKEETIINDSTALAVLESNGITLTEVKSPEFPETKLGLTEPEGGSSLEEGIIPFSFSVEGGEYTLGTQTEDAEVKGCSNSGKGQHIHLILNNEPYSAHYEPEFEKELDAGSYVALAFISRSYHESLKHDGAAVLTQFSVGGAEVEDFDLSGEHLFYSRPKGSYEGEAVNKVMLDFYLVNTQISEEGNFVQVTLDGETVFKITKWVPYFMEGLALGDHTIKIELMNAEGNAVEGPFNVEERTFTLVNE